MNDQGKLDRPVVPMKSPNNAGQPIAEEMEGSGLAKGNPRQQNAPRTPSRHGAPSALDGTADEEGELAARHRHPWILRHHLAGSANAIRFVPDEISTYCRPSSM
jgi:hypothetical protein